MTMTHAEAQSESVPPDAESLAGFLEELKSSGYRIGPDQHVLVSDLVAAMVARGPMPEPAEFAGLLGPLLCKSARQQAEFPERFARWLQTSRSGPAAAKSPSAITDPNQLAGFLGGIQRRNRIATWLMVAIVLVVMGATAWLFRPRTPLSPAIPTAPSRTLPPQPTAKTQKAQQEAAVSIGAVFAVCVALLVFFGVAWILIWRHRAQLFLSRRKVTGPPDITRVNVQSLLEVLLPGRVISPLARAMRRRVELASTDIAVEPTLEETLNRGGWFTPVYGRVRIPPEYLILVSRGGNRDAGAVLARELMSRLNRSAVLMNCFYFEDDPRVLIPFKPARGKATDAGRPILLREVESVSASMRLLVVTDARAIAALAPAEVDAWTSRFQAWTDRNLLSTAPVDTVSPGYRILARQFSIFLASEHGFTELARKLETGRASPNSAVVPLPPVPEMLVRRPGQWLDALAPEPRQIDSLLLALRAYLRPGGFQWLAACAAYPQIDPNLTLYLGHALHTADGAPLFDALTLGCLNRLVWFRQGYMPDWLRIALLNSMSPQGEQEARNALSGLLIGALSGDISTADLRIAQEHEEIVSRLMRAILRRLAATSDPDAPYEDRVFLSFLAGRAAVSAPRVLRNLLTTGSMRGRLDRTPDFRVRQIRTPRILMVVGLLVALGAAGLAYGLSFYSVILAPFTLILGLMLLRAVWRTRNPWVLGAMLLLSYCYVGGWLALLLAETPLWIALPAGAAVLAAVAAVFTAAWSGIPFRREPVPIGPVRRLWGHAGLAGIAIMTFVAPLLLLADPFRGAAVLAILALPVPVGTLLTFSALPTTAKWTLRTGLFLLFAYLIVFGFVLGVAGIIASAAAFEIALIYGLVRSWREWRAASSRLAKPA